MEQPWWMASPAPALFVRPRSSDFEWDLNHSARQWARESAVSADMLARVARDVGLRSATTAAGAVGATPLDADRSALRWHSMPCHEGWLAWCLPDELYAPAPDDLLDRVDILRQSGPSFRVEEARDALVMADVAVWRLDLASGRIYGNQVCFDRMQREMAVEGFDHDWVLSQYHPDDRPLALQANERALKGDAVVDAVLRFRYVEDAPYRPLLTRRVARRNAQGLPVEVVGVALDIGDSVRLSQEAQAAAQRAVEIEKMAGIGCWTLEPDSGRAEWDAGMFALHDRQPQRGTPTYHAWVEEYVHPDDRSRLRGALSAKAHVERKPYADHCRIVRGDGKVRYLTISGHYVERPAGMELCGTMADITDKRSVSDALRMELERTRFASEAAGLGSWECSLAGEPLNWNAQMYRLHGLDPRDARPLKQLWTTAHRPADLGQLRRAIGRHVESGQPLEHELRTLWPDGSEHWITIRGRVMLGSGGRTERVCGVSWDLTQRKHLERGAESLRTALLGLKQRSSGDAPWASADDALAKIDHLLGALRAPHESQAVLRPLTLLCIVDSAVNLMMIEQLVQPRPNVTLHSARNGQSGVELALRLRPHMVLVDASLPDVDGYEVLRRLREHAAFSGTTMIMLSANALQSDIDRAVAAGFDGYWPRPIDREVFLSGLDALSHGDALRR